MLRQGTYFSVTIRFSEINFIPTKPIRFKLDARCNGSYGQTKQAASIDHIIVGGLVVFITSTSRIGFYVAAKLMDEAHNAIRRGFGQGLALQIVGNQERDRVFDRCVFYLLLVVTTRHEGDGRQQKQANTKSYISCIHIFRVSNLNAKIVK